MATDVGEVGVKHLALKRVILRRDASQVYPTKLSHLMDGEGRCLARVQFPDRNGRDPGRAPISPVVKALARVMDNPHIRCIREKAVNDSA